MVDLSIVFCKRLPEGTDLDNLKPTRPGLVWYHGGPPIPILIVCSHMFHWGYVHIQTNPHLILLPIGSMYGIYTNIGGILMVNVTIYSIHGSYGLYIVGYI